MNLIIIISLILQMNTTTMIEDKATLIYIGDPMCSWCYGFAEEITAAKDSLEDKVNFELVMGGLRPYNTETMKALGDFLEEHWHHVEERSGQPFNYEILKDHSFIYDTEPPSRAVKVMETLKSEESFAFFKAIQKAFYAENKNTNDVKTYMDLAEQFNVDGEQFKALYESVELKNAVRADFERSANMGVSGFPTIVLKIGDEHILISNGYTTATSILLQVDKYLMRHKSKKASSED